MTRITRVSYLTLPALVTALIGVPGCSSSNNPATSAGAGGSTAGVVRTGGSASTSTSDSTTGGDGDMATGGADTSGGGAGATGGAATGASTGGSTATSTAANIYTPSCTGIITAGGLAPSKGNACTAADIQLCYKTCGPENKGFKSETCSASTASTTGFAYAEEPSGPPCHFPPSDYGCYKVPTADGAGCPASPPKHGDPCTIAACIPCGFNGGYLDSSGNPKTGFCVCVAPTDTTTQKWSCATYPSAWPCGPNMAAGSTGC